MSKRNCVTVIGPTGSGKTSYLLGMYMALSGNGRRGISLSAVDKAVDLRFEKLWKNIRSGGQFPDTTDRSEIFQFNSSYSYKPLISFDWKDFPGGWLSSDDQEEHPEHIREVVESVKESTSLLVVINGSEICDQIESHIARKRLHGKAVEQDYLDAVVMPDDGYARSLTKIFNELNDESIPVPDVGVIVTKSDLIIDCIASSCKDLDNCERIYQEAVKKLVKDWSSHSLCFERIVVPMAVSIGNSIGERFVAHTQCVEQPIAFAVVNMLIEAATRLRKSIENNRDYLNETSGFFSEWWNKNSRRVATENISALERELGERINSAIKTVSSAFAESHIGYNGVAANSVYVHEYFRKKFESI